MTSSAREAFLSDLTALRESVDSDLVTSPNAVGSFLRRGLTIISYNLLEAFVSHRLEEASTFINSGHSHFSDLPDKLKRAAAQELLKIGNSRVQWAGPDLSSILQYTTRLGHSLAASNGPVSLSPLMWHWAGSNMGVEDLKRTLRLFHVDNPWDTIRSLAARVGFPMQDPRTTLAGMLRERNGSAHNASHTISNLWIRAIPNQLLVIGFGIDACLSLSATRMHAADLVFYQNESWLTPGRITFRFVQERKRQWAEIVEGRRRAARLSEDRRTATRAAIGAAAKEQFQIVVVQNAASEVLDWTYPHFP